MPDGPLRAHLLDLFRYTRWADRLVIEALSGADDPEREPLRRARVLLSHLLRAQTVWLGRVQGTEAAQLPFWEVDSLEACARRSDASIRVWLAFLRDCSEADFVRPVRYRNSKGKAYATPLGAIATHVVNHSTHHRAQMALLLRKAGMEPPATDYIYYVRSTEATRGAPA